MSKKTVIFKCKVAQLRRKQGNIDDLVDLFPNVVVKSDGRKTVFVKGGKDALGKSTPNKRTTGRATGKVGTMPMSQLKQSALRRFAK